MFNDFREKRKLGIEQCKYNVDEMGRTCGANGGGKRGAQGVGGET
jgi:hypothetical protein